jgi:hypothetical protein
MRQDTHERHALMRLLITPSAFGPLAPGESVAIQLCLHAQAGGRQALVAVRAQGGEQQIVPLRVQVGTR